MSVALAGLRPSCLDEDRAGPLYRDFRRDCVWHLSHVSTQTLCATRRFSASVLHAFNSSICAASFSEKQSDAVGVLKQYVKYFFLSRIERVKQPPFG